MGIVERLRDFGAFANPGGIYEGLPHEAADEIERLEELLWQEAGNRVEIERLKERVASLQASSGYELSIAKLEIERLRAAYDSRGGEMDSMRMVLAETQQWNEDRVAEIEQLKRKKRPPAGEG
jgi:hypothetical protein